MVMNPASRSNTRSRGTECPTTRGRHDPDTLAHLRRPKSDAATICQSCAVRAKVGFYTHEVGMQESSGMLYPSSPDADRFGGWCESDSPPCVSEVSWRIHRAVVNKPTCWSFRASSLWSIRSFEEVRMPSRAVREPSPPDSRRRRRPRRARAAREVPDAARLRRHLRRYGRGRPAAPAGEPHQRRGHRSAAAPGLGQRSRALHSAADAGRHLLGRAGGVRTAGADPPEHPADPQAVLAGDAGRNAAADDRRGRAEGSRQRRGRRRRREAEGVTESSDRARTRRARRRASRSCCGRRGSG